MVFASRALTCASFSACTPKLPKRAVFSECLICVRSHRKYLVGSCSVISKGQDPTRIVFSIPLDYELEEVEDFYRVYPQWCPDLQTDLGRIWKHQLHVPPQQVAKFLRYAREHSDCCRVFLNPGKLKSRQIGRAHV